MELQMNSLFADSFDDANVTPHMIMEPPKPTRESTNWYVSIENSEKINVHAL